MNLSRTFEPFTSRAIRIDMKDIDTDIIIPAQFLKITDKAGLGDNVFYNLRKGDPEFPMNRPEFKDARIVVAGKNFGCGSSREHAPWALKGAGIDVVISSEFADIFKGNAEKNGVLPLILPEKIVQKLLHPINDTDTITVDLASQIVRDHEGVEYGFNIASFPKKRFLENMSDLDYLIDYAPQIRVFEEKRKKVLFGIV